MGDPSEGGRVRDMREIDHEPIFSVICGGLSLIVIPLTSKLIVKDCPGAFSG